jgi:hypothetical protein
MKQKLNLLIQLLLTASLGFSQTNQKDNKTPTDGIVQHKSRQFTETNLSQNKINKLPENEQQAVIINVADDITWDETTFINRLGYKNLTIEKGVYQIVKTSQYPYGIIQLNVKGPVKLNNEQFYRSFPGPYTFNAGVISCNMPGFLCCVVSPVWLDKVVITPIVEKDNLTRIQIQFLTEEITNGKKFLPPNVTESVNSQMQMPTYPFIVEFSKKGGYTSNNAAFLKSSPALPLMDVFREIAANLKARLNNDLILAIDSNGKFTSSDESILKSNSNIAALFNTFRTPKKNASITVAITAKTYRIFGIDDQVKNWQPFLNKIQHGIASIQQKLDKNETFVLKLTDNGLIISSNQKIIRNGEAFKKNILVANASMHWNYDEFKACVGDWWFLPGINVVACAIGCAIACAD